jgi:hypothetical protein
VRALLLMAPLALGGCSFLVPLDDLTSGTVSDGGLQACRSSVRLDRDSDNCGVCGHSCGGGDCNQGSCQPVNIRTAENGPLGIFVDGGGRTAGFVYWVNQKRPALRRANKDGKFDISLNDETDFLQKPFDIGVEGPFLYWSDQHVVHQKPLAGGSATAPPISTGGGDAGFIAVDGSRVYVSAVQRQGMPSGVIQDQTNNLHSGAFLVDGLAVSGTVLFWIETVGDMQEIDSGIPNGEPLAAMFQTATTKASGLAVDGDAFYWVEDGRRVRRAGRHGGSTATLFEASQPFGAGDIAVDDAFIYWTEPATGLVRRLAKPAPSPDGGQP